MLYHTLYPNILQHTIIYIDISIYTMINHMKVLSFCNFFSILLASTNLSQFFPSLLSFFLLLISWYCHHFPVYLTVSKSHWASSAWLSSHTGYVERQTQDDKLYLLSSLDNIDLICVVANKINSSSELAPSSLPRPVAGEFKWKCDVEKVLHFSHGHRPP